MEKSYRYKKKLVIIGGSMYVLLPATWLKKNTRKDIAEVIVEVYEKYIKVISLKNQNG